MRSSRSRFRSAYYRARGYCNDLVRAAVTILVRTQRQRWRRVAHSGTPPWDERNAMLASYIPSGSSVLDLGSGAQTLRLHLQGKCQYQPCDLFKSTPDVIVCDFNAGKYPQLASRYDYVVCSGVLEYIWDPGSFVSRAASLGSHMLLSYNIRSNGDKKLNRLAHNWVNHLTQECLERLITANQLSWQLVGRRGPNELIYLIKAQRPMPD